MAQDKGNSEPGPLGPLKVGLRRRLKAAVFTDATIKTIRSVHGDFLRREPIVLTQQEQTRLFREVLQDIVEEILGPR